MASKAVSSPVEIRCKGVLFDMDGILISSIDSVERSWTRWAEMRGVDPEFACKMAHGRRAIETAALLRPDLDSHAELKLIEDIELADGEGLAILPGVLNLLRALPHDRWTVVTLLGIPPDECVVFEDAESGALAGRAAGCVVIATTFSHEIESLAAAHYLIEDVTGVQVRNLPGEQGIVLTFSPLAAD
jgi:mannitol-1-/sugar-/sorbitol-6-phosphatase